ncbi:MAG: cytochrome D1 domain-containing protein [Pseudomonadota bacterium]|uniref:Cytochrome D1 domain-containing protein n=1 Tax=Polaromonas aquatica TaxID=332657 RepID=A0ABW1TS25_9BURK
MNVSARFLAARCFVVAAGFCVVLPGVSLVQAQTAAKPAAPASATTAPAAMTSPVFVLNSLDASVSVIDPQTWTETKRIATGKQPHHLYLTPDERSVIVANALSDSLTFIDPKTAEVQRTVRGIIDPYQLRFSPDMKWFVTAANRLNHIDIYKWDGKDITLVKRVPTGKTPSHLWIDSKSTTIYSTMQDSDELIAIDLASQAVKWRTKTGSIPADVYGTADDKFLLVGLTGGDAVEVYDVSGKTPSRTKVIKTGAGAHAFRAFGDQRHVLVSNRVANSISRIDLKTMEVVDNYPAPGGPDCIDVSRDGKLIMVTSRWIKKLTVIDVATRKIVRQVNVGKSPHGVWTLDHAPR